MKELLGGNGLNRSIDSVPVSKENQIVSEWVREEWGCIWNVLIPTRVREIPLLQDSKDVPEPFFTGLSTACSHAASVTDRRARQQSRRSRRITVDWGMK
jgi:hypothetical protein